MVCLAKLGYSPEPEKEVKYTELVPIKDSISYSVYYNANANEYNRYLPTIQKMIDSIRITTALGSILN